MNKLFLLVVLLVFVTLPIVTSSSSSSSSLTISSALKQSAKNEKPIIVAGKPVQKVVAPANKSAAALKMAGLFFIWYAFNAAYNVYNAYIKADIQLPWTISTVQLLVGLLYAVPLWFLKVRKAPNLTFNDIKAMMPIAILNAFGHAAAVVAMFEKGGGSFTHVIKASEPVVSVLLNFLVMGIVPKPLTAMSLIPVSYGVAYASTLGDLNPKSFGKELTTKAAKMAMVSNFAFAMRSILRKNLPADFKTRTNMDPGNDVAVTTILSMLILIPVVLYFEGAGNVIKAVSSVKNQGAFAMNVGICGMSFYLYNEMQNFVLSSLGPVPTAVGNTLKRVAIFVALYYFTKGETFPPAKILGCAIAIAGCLSFAIFDAKKM